LQWLLKVLKSASPGCSWPTTRWQFSTHPEPPPQDVLPPSPDTATTRTATTDSRKNMARKRLVFFSVLYNPFEGVAPREVGRTQPLLASTAFCIVLSAVLATAPVNSGVPRAKTLAQTQSLIQQGKTLYKVGHFTEAVKVVQQAASAPRSPALIRGHRCPFLIRSSSGALEQRGKQSCGSE